MQKEFKLPELGENIEAADIVNVLVNEGDFIKKDQGLVEIETDKATIEVPSALEGKIIKLLVKPGDKVKVGQTIIIVEDSAEETKPTQTEKAEGSPSKSQPSEEKTATKIPEKPITQKQTGKKEIIDFRLPDLGENIESAEIVKVLIKVGDFIDKDQGIIEIETDKATIEVPSTVSGKVIEVLVKSGDKAKVGQTIIKVETGDTEVKEDIIKPQLSEEPQEVSQPEIKAEQKPVLKGELPEIHPMETDEQPPIMRGAAPAAPSVRRLAREIGVDINKVPGTGPGGRITMDDVKAYSKKLHEARAEGAGFISGVKAEALPDFSKFGETKKVEMSNIRKKTAEHLSYAWATIPHVTQFDKADITNLEKARKELSKSLEKSGVKLTVTAILVKVIVEALKRFPQFNSSIDMEKKEIIYKNYFNIGIAVDTEHGLIVPVIKNADKKSLTEISVEMNSLAEKARAKKIGLDDLQGGCFTITNLGGIGGTYFTPIVNSPEVAILGVSRSNYEPVWNGYGVFEPRLMLPLSLSYDHRIIDGADAIRFLRFIVEALEQPLRIIL